MPTPAVTAWLPLALLLALSGCSQSDSPPASQGATPPRATPVIVQPVVLETEQIRLEAVGTSRALRSIELHAVASGEVTAVHFSAGQQVASGQLLLQLDNRDEQLALELGQVQLAEAERLLRRYLNSRAAGAVTESDLDSARSAVEAARIELKRAEVALEERRVEAPFSGVIGVTDIDAGQRITPDTAIAPLDDRTALLVTFEVPEALLGRLERSFPVTLSPWSSGEREQGHIVDVGSRIDPISRTFTVRAELPNPADRLRPGMGFRVELVISGPAYPVVPEVAVQWGGDGAYIWQVVAEQAHRLPITIVQRREGRVLVSAPLKAGDKVVREGVQRMREGLSVRYQAPADQP